MKTLFRNAKIVLKNRVVSGNVLVENGRITAIGKAQGRAGADRTLDCRGRYVLPGFFETHMHGINYDDCIKGSIDPRTFQYTNRHQGSISRIMRFLPSIGVTSAFLSSYAAPRPLLDRFLAGAAEYQAQEHPGHARLLGVDLEGNFLKDPAFAGAQDPDAYLEPSVPVFRELQEKAGGLIVKALIAPEWGKNAYALMAYMAKNRLFPSVGHTGCTKAEMIRAHRSGARVVVHCGNGPMSQNFKSGGALDGVFEIGAGFYGELICDFKHVNPRWINTFMRAFSLEHTLAVSDAGGLSGAPIPEGARIGDCVVRDRALWLAAKSNTLAGSLMTLDRDFNNMLNLFTSDRKAFFQDRADPPLTLDKALPRLCRVFSLNAAELFGHARRAGSLEKGKRADLIVCRITGGPGRYAFRVEKAFVDGVAAAA